MHKIIENKEILITGGTGSFGQAFCRRVLQHNVKTVKIFSRDELKQHELRQELDDSRVQYYVGDVRDEHSLTQPMHNVDYVFHAAALKQVPSSEFFPMQALKTNILGAHNVIRAATAAGVKTVVALSTDKAVYPINVMGMTKALMEKYLIAESRHPNAPLINITRYGNVMGSRGSVIPSFIKSIKSERRIQLTNPKMTRFMMSMDEAIDLVLHALSEKQSGKIFVHKAPATSLEILSSTLQKILGPFDISVMGTRHGEKLHEVLIGSEEMDRAVETEKYFEISPDNRNLNYSKYFDSGNINTNATQYQFDSKVAYQLQESELELKILNLLMEMSNTIEIQK